MARRVSAQKALEMIMDMQEHDTDDVSEVGEGESENSFSDSDYEDDSGSPSDEETLPNSPDISPEQSDRDENADVDDDINQDQHAEMDADTDMWMNASTQLWRDTASNSKAEMAPSGEKFPFQKVDVKKSV